MRFRKPRHGRGSVNMDVTPILDTAFNLLLFFALSFNFGVAPGLKVKLPEASAEALKKENKEITVSISKEGVLSLEGKTVTVNDLTSRFKALRSKNPDAMVIVQGDAEALHGKVVQVMDAAKGAGLSKLAIATRPKEGR
ncbi:MAG: biopolymer transporter ExbD [Deltaproteobacteria bacterium]